MENNRKMVPKRRFKEFQNAGDWEQRKLGKIGYTYTGLSGKTKEDFGHGDAQFITYMNVFSNSINDPTMVEPIEIDAKQNEVEVGDVFFTTSSETPEEVGMTSVLLEKHGKTYLNSFCFGYRPMIKINSYFLAYMLRSKHIREKIILLAQGISRYNISKTKVMEIAVPIPSLSEQKCIGQYLYDLDNIITLHQRKLDKIKAIKKAYLSEMFPQNGEKKPRRRFKGFTDDWEQRKLGEIFEEYSEKGHPELPALTIIQGGGTIRRDESDRSLQYDKASLANYKMVNDGDFIVHLRSFEGGLEKATTLGIISPAYHTFHGEGTDSRFYYSYFRSPKFIDQDLKPHVYGIRDGRSIDIEGMKTIEIPWTSFDEQKAIGDYIDTLDNLITLHQRKLEKLKNIKKAYLNEMFV